MFSSYSIGLMVNLTWVSVDGGCGTRIEAVEERIG